MNENTFFGEIKRNRLILTLYLPSFIMAMSQGVLLPVLPLFAKDLEASYGLVGLVVAGLSLGMLIGDLPAGMLLRTLGKKGSMLLGFTLATISTTAIFWTQSVPIVLLLRLFSGFGIAMFGIARLNYMADVVEVSNRGRVIALLGGVFRLGRLTGPALGGLVAATYGLRIPFLITGGALGLGLIAVILFVTKTEQASQAESESIKSPKAHLISTLKANSDSLTFAGTGQLFARMLRTSRNIIIPLYAADVLGLDVETIGYVLSISAAIDVSLFFPAGWIMDRFGRKVAIIPAFLIMGMGMFLVGFSQSTAGLIFATAIIGLGNGLSSGAFQIIGADLAPQEGRGEFLGAWRLIGDIGATGGPLVVGAVADIFVLPAAAVVVATTGLISAGIFLFKVPETLKNHQESIEMS